MNIVITGSTKGIGYGMAREFLKREHDVMISSRRVDAVQQAVADLQEQDNKDRHSGSAMRVMNTGGYY